MHTPDDFRLFYNRTIQPELQRLDKERRRMLRRIFLSMILMVAVGVVIYEMHVFVFALLSVIPFFIYISYQLQRINKFRDKFKPRVVELVLDFIDDDLLFGDLKYNAKGIVDKEKFIRSNIFGATPAVYNGEDYIEGRIGDVEFEMCELDVQEFSRVRARLDQVFRGIFVRAKFFYQPKGKLLVVPRGVLPHISPAVKAFIRDDGQVMDGFLKDEAFTDVYAVYGSKNTRIKDLLTKNLMAFLLEHQEKAGKIYLALNNENCYVAIESDKDILEPKIFQSNVSFRLVSEFYNDIYVALYVVRALDESH